MILFLHDDIKVLMNSFLPNENINYSYKHAGFVLLKALKGNYPFELNLIQI